MVKVCVVIFVVKEPSRVRMRRNVMVFILFHFQESASPLPRITVRRRRRVFSTRSSSRKSDRENDAPVTPCLLRPGATFRAQ
jgi:hypothetical protein